MKYPSHEVPQQTPLIKDWARNQGYTALGFPGSLLDCDSCLVFVILSEMGDRGISPTLLNASLHQPANSSLTYNLQKMHLLKWEIRSFKSHPQTNPLLPALHYSSSTRSPSQRPTQALPWLSHVPSSPQLSSRALPAWHRRGRFSHSLGGCLGQDRSALQPGDSWAGAAFLGCLWFCSAVPRPLCANRNTWISSCSTSKHPLVHACIPQG